MGLRTITKCLGFQTTAVGTATPVGLQVPTGLIRPTFAKIQAEGAAMRYRDDGVDPTPTTGMFMQLNVPYDYDGDLTKIKFISTSGGAIINALFYA